jgi:hypothetical protein
LIDVGAPAFRVGCASLQLDRWRQETVMTTKNTASIAVALVAFAAGAHAAGTEETSARAPHPPAASVQLDEWGTAPVASTRLSGMRGGSTVSANVAQNGALQNTSASNVTTGSNTVSGGSFANASGLPTVIQNSGANVVIQNSTVVNVLFRP